MVNYIPRAVLPERAHQGKLVSTSPAVLSAIKVYSEVSRYGLAIRLATEPACGGCALEEVIVCEPQSAIFE